ncbi:MAG: gliding motility-associated C-terminal domain-containing protein [Bacteroidetes bacterium]|nr:gliding motility-associated C-terminal domain-containing protein [Bacteroidota bacterium]
MKKHILALLLITFSLVTVKAQIDTSFWFVAPDISATLGDNPINLHIQTYSQAATVYVRQPANPAGVNATLTIGAAANGVLNLTPSITAVEGGPVNAVSQKGIYISSNAKVSVYYTIGAGFSKEMISLKGQRSVGTDFYTPIPNSLTTSTTFTDSGVGFDIVATGSGTTVILITPRAACVGRAKNVTFSKSLLQGETFSVRDLNTVNPSELGGSIISADKPVAVTVSGIVQNAGCNSNYADQITASDQIGKDHVILRSPTGTTDIAYILATVNSTSLAITNSTTTINWLINFGETYSVSLTSPITYIKSDKPVYVIHASGYGCKLSAAQVAPAYCAGSYTTAFVRLSNDSLNLNVVTRSGYQNTFTLSSNGSNIPVSAASFTTVPGTSGNLVAAKLFFPTSTIPVGSYNVLKNSQDLFGLGIHNGGFLGGSAYAYGSEFGASAFVYANVVPTATICSNNTFTLNGQIGGGPNAGVFSYNGFGTLSGPNTQIINNVYTPNAVDTNIKPVKFILTSTGNCPNKSDTFKLTVKQAPIVNAGFDIVTCSNNPTVQLSGNVIGPTTQGVWSVMAPGNGTFAPSVNSFTSVYNLSNTDTSMASIKIVLTSINNAGCNAVSDTMKIIVNKAPAVRASTINPIVRCANNSSIFLNGSVTGTTTSSGFWSTTGTGYFTPNNLSLICNYVPSLTDITTGTISLKLTSSSPSSSQCKAVSDSVLVIFTQPVTVSTGVDLNSCKNNPIVPLSAIITGTATNTGIWYGGSGSFSPSNTALTPTYAASASEISTGYVTLTFSTTNNGICTGVNDQIRIDFRDKPTANFTVNTVCLNQPTNFTDQSVNTSGLGSITNWQWSFGNGATATATNAASQVNTYSTAGNYTAQLVINSSFGCYDTIKRPVTVYVLPVAGMTISRSCSGSAQQISFTDQSSIPAPGVIPPTGYYWDFGGFGFSVAKDTAIIFPSQGLYNITHVVTSSNGCVSTITQSVNITPKPQAKFLYINNTIQTLETNVSFIDSSKAAVSWAWNFGNNTTSNIQNPTSVYTANGSYTVSLTITDQFGCADTYTALVRISNIVSEVAQLIPNIISPNNDGKNDFWRLDFINVFYPKAEIEIYNRWGEQLFKSTGYSNAWDGSYKGSPLPVGAYYYTINLNDSPDSKPYKGTVTLLK